MLFSDALTMHGETIFLTMNVGSDTTYSTYTGIANVPSATVKAGETSFAAVYTKSGDKAATVVFLLNNNNVNMSSSNQGRCLHQGQQRRRFLHQGSGYFL